MKRQLHTPEGVRDIFGKECEKKHVIDRAIKDAILSFGYEQIETPTFEFFDIWGNGIGTISSADMYKFFDRDGNTLALRPDITPSIARAYASFLKDISPLRLFYSGNVYINHRGYLGRLRETTQIGAEYIGDDSIEADSELVALSIEALKSCGLTDFTISIGHVNFWQGLIELGDFSAEDEEEIHDLVLNKNFFGLEELLVGKGVDERLKTLYTSAGRLFESPEAFKDLEELSKGYGRIEETFSYFKKLYELLECFGVSEFVSFDLGLASLYRYYTGILFSGYTYGSGEPILKGGRYDRLLSFFGSDRPAIGFAILSDSIARALERQGKRVELYGKREAIIYNKECFKDAVQRAAQDREKGFYVGLYRKPTDEEEYTALADRLSKEGLDIISIPDSLQR